MGFQLSQAFSYPCPFCGDFLRSRDQISPLIFFFFFSRCFSLSLLLPCCLTSSCIEMAEHEHFHLQPFLCTYNSGSPNAGQSLLE